MFPKQALAALDAATPKLNPILAQGLAVTHLKEGEGYIDAVLRSVAPGFPPGFRYLGCRRCTPMEEYLEAIKVRQAQRRVLDVALSTVYLMRYEFEYTDPNGDPRDPSSKTVIVKHLYLPFVKDAGTIYLSGSRFVISPILADRVISVGIMNIFIRLLKAKLTFNRVSHAYMADGKIENVQVVWSKIHNDKSTSSRATVRANSTMVHYLLCKYGFTGMFHRFLGIAPVVGGENINEENFPSKDWVICQSTGVRPRGVRTGYPTAYAGSPIRVAVKRSEYKTTVKDLIAGFFYVVDHFPAYVKPEHVEDEKLWMQLLGYVIWANNDSAGKLISNVQDHISSLDEYVDSISKIKLDQINFPSQDIYQLFFLIISNFNDWMLMSGDRVSTMYDKELAILQFVFFSIIESINKLYFKLNGAKRKELNLGRITDLLNQSLKPGLIYSLTKNSGVCSTASTSGDCMALKITNILVPQSSSNRLTASKARAVISDPAKRLHASIAEVGCYAALPKSSPDGRARLNLCVHVDSSGLIQRNPKFKELLDRVQDMIRRQ